MWCHLCKKEYKDYEDFKVHILKVHRCASEFYKDSTDSEESKDENEDASEIDENRSSALSDQEAAKFMSDAGSEDISSKSDTSYSSKLPAKKKTYALRKRTLPRRKKSITSYQEDSSEHSDDDISGHSENLTNIKKEQTTAISQPMVNNQLYVINPYVGQGANNYVMGNQAIQQPLYVINPFVAKSPYSDCDSTFDFSSKNILKWLAKLKELCRTMKFPLPMSLFNHVKTVHKGIFDHYCMVSSGEETIAVMKVYEELNNMIHKHISQINDGL